MFMSTGAWPDCRTVNGGFVMICMMVFCGGGHGCHDLLILKIYTVYVVKSLFVILCWIFGVCLRFS